MSGQPYKYAKDVNMYRQNYMDSLNLRTSLDDVNLQANKTYKATGQLPAVSSIPDTRTTAEKFADIEKMKLTLVADMKPIADTNTALDIIQKIINDPLNKDGKMYEFFAQRVKGIVAKVLPDFGFGLYGQNDISKFVASIKELYETAISLKDTTAKYFSASGYTIADDLNENLISQYAEVLKQYRTKFHINNDENTKLLKYISQNFGRISELKKQINLIIKALYNIPPQFQDENYHKLVKYIDEELDDTLNSVSDDSISKDISDLLIDIRNSNRSAVTLNITETHDSTILIEETLQDVVNMYNRIKQSSSSQSSSSQSSSSQSSRSQSSGSQSSIPFEVGGYGAQAIHPEPPEPIIEIDDPEVDSKQAMIDEIKSLSSAQLEDELNRSTDVFNELGMLEYAKKMLKYKQINGQGLRRRGRPRGRGIAQPFIQRIDHEAGIKASPQFIPLGKYVVNNKKLHDNIVTIKTIKGTNVIGYPSTKVSPLLSKVIKNIIGGGLPSYEDMSKLSEAEKQYLYKLSKKSDILDKVNIPAPSKDQQDKDNHNFEVMRGEIMSGNDNKELVKKFKTLILKLSKQGDLPKSQVAEILTDLAELGY